MDNVIPAIEEYADAELALSRAFHASTNKNDPQNWQIEAAGAIRSASNAAVAIDGLTDRATRETDKSKTQIRKELRNLCNFGVGGYLREGAHDRVRGVASVYKHDEAQDATIPLNSSDDVLAGDLGFGFDAYGVGKYSGPEVSVGQTAGNQSKFLGDVVAAVCAWFQLLSTEGAVLPEKPVKVINVMVHSGASDEQKR